MHLINCTGSYFGIAYDNKNKLLNKKKAPEYGAYIIDEIN